MKTQEQIENDLKAIMASPSESEMTAKMSAYILSLTDQEMEFASAYMARWRKAAEEHFRSKMG